MITVTNVQEKMQQLTPIRNRGEHTSEDEVIEAFSTLTQGNFVDAGIFLGSFNGNAGWERHVKGDELIHVVAGCTELDVIVDNQRQTLELSSGMLLVVPQGCWHRFRSKDGVTVLTATPRFDEKHTFVDDPQLLCVGD